jgi:hypothetical protein|tara:strand:+ start:708 stop:1136 length:429 start_codon:yes stop_codon:yes gene_type:complete
MNWERLKQNHYFEDPVTHIYAQNVFNANEYDRLYENQNNLNHQTWQEFDSKYRTGFEFKDNFSDIDFNKEIICLWFFKERSDNTRSYVSVNGKQLTYLPNTFLIAESKDIGHVQTKKKYLRHPFVQIDMTNNQWQTLLSKFR